MTASSTSTNSTLYLSNMKQIQWEKYLKFVKLSAETFSAVLPIIKLLAVALGCFAVAVLWNGQQDKYEQQIAAALSHADISNQEVERLTTEIANQKKVADLLRIQANQKIDAIQVRTVVVDTLKVTLEQATTVTDSLTTLLKIVPQQDTIITQQKEVIQIQETEIVTLRQMTANYDSTVTVLQESNKTLYNALEQVKNKDKIFGIQLPSRKTSLLAGILIGTAITIGVFR